MSNELEHVTRCPKCFGRDVRPSLKGGFFDGLMLKLHRTPFRCRSCQNRFYVFISAQNDEVEEAAEPVEGEVAQAAVHAMPPEGHAAPPDGDGVHNQDVAKPAEH